MKASAALRKEADSGDCWKGFRPGDWSTSINVRDFIVRNVTPYKGSEDFLAGPSQRTKAVWAKPRYGPTIIEKIDEFARDERSLVAQLCIRDSLLLMVRSACNEAA
jgi:hypothetical protein